MKKILLIIAVLFSLNSFCQDTTKITVSCQARDLEYIAALIYTDNAIENLYDSVKTKFRVQSPPTGTTTVSVIGTALDWYIVYEKIQADPVAIKANCTSRVEALLRGVNLIWLTAKLDELLVNDTNEFQAKRGFGRNRLRRL